MATASAPFSLRWFLVLLGVVLVCLLIWFVGPYFAFADVKPLASTTGRWVAVLLVVAAWAVIWQWRQWRAVRTSEALAGAAAGASSGAPGGTASSSASGAIAGADSQLAAKFREAMDALRKSKGGARSLVDLPWYVIIGPPGAGKTTAFKNSGLEFPLEDRFGREAVRGVGGTRSCDWWFTTEAVLLDTAGRYTTQDSDERADSAGWIEFLKLLKTHRRHRPINGVLLALSAPDIANFTDEMREKHALAIRARLQELHQYLGVQLPVYVLLTKADLIAGFQEYFDDLDQGGRSQVWGVTFPLEDSRRGQAQGRFGAELDELVARLSARLPERLQAERDVGRRRAMFAFPQQVASLKAGIQALLRDVFASSALDDRVWLRGVYFTSGTQEGTPIDRMMGALARTFGLAVQALAAAPTHGKAFFINRLLRSVVFTESGIAGSDRRAEIRTNAALLGCYILIAVLTAGIVAGMVASYHANSAYLARVAAAAAPLSNIKSAGRSASLADTVPPLDAVRSVVDAAAAPAGGVPWSMRFGLSQVGPVSAAAKDAYFRELNLSLTAAAARDFATRIESSSSPDQLYEYLKAYLMLGQPNRLVAAQMKQISDPEWSRALPDDPETAARVATHFDTLVSEPDRVQPVPLDADLVERARVSLQQASLPLLMYSRVRLSYAGDTQRAIHLDKELGLGAQTVFVRRSGRPLGEPFAALYTRAVFDEFNSKGKLQLVAQFLEESWVFGDRAPPVTQSPRLAGDVVQLYETDYIKAWDALLRDVTLRAPRDTAEAANILGTLASPTSALKRLLVLVDANTNLLAPPPAGDVQAAAAAQLSNAAGKLDGALGVTPGPKPGTLVTQHFAALQALVVGPPGQAPIDRLLAQMAQAQQQLQAATGLGGQPGSAAVLSAIQNSIGSLQGEASQLPPEIGSMVAGLSGQSKSVALGVAHSDLTNRYQSQVVSACRELLGSGYPFNKSSATDVTLEDFGRVFGGGGIYDSFFQANLAALVDTTGPTWRWRTGAEAIGGSAALLAQFQAADRLRQLFFAPGGGQVPAARFTLTPDELDADVDRFRLEVDGQSMEYHHGPPQAVSMSWPGGAVGMAIVTFELHNGAHPQIAYQGPWALFRLLDAATVEPKSGTEFLLTFRSNGKQARLLMEAASIRNPFGHADVTRFRCGG
jgi:type VI secretion system protein ImpL